MHKGSGSSLSERERETAQLPSLDFAASECIAKLCYHTLRDPKPSFVLMGAIFSDLQPHIH